MSVTGLEMQMTGIRRCRMAIVLSVTESRFDVLIVSESPTQAVGFESDSIWILMQMSVSDSTAVWNSVLHFSVWWHAKMFAGCQWHLHNLWEFSSNVSLPLGGLAESELLAVIAEICIHIVAISESSALSERGLNREEWLARHNVCQIWNLVNRRCRPLVWTAINHPFNYARLIFMCRLTAQKTCDMMYTLNFISSHRHGSHRH